MVYLVYNFVLAVGLALALPWFAWRGWRTGKYSSNLRERMGRLPAGLHPSGAPSLWIHAVSVGEVLAVRPLLEPLKERFPHHRLFVSTTTLTGQAIARNTLKSIDGLFFAPFDLPSAVRKVLLQLRPTLLVLVETEIWPNLIHEAHGRGIRVAVVNGRISPRSFPRYRRVRRLLRMVLGEIDLFLMQSEPHARRVVEIGAPADRVRVAGNLKFDALSHIRPSDALSRLIGSRHSGAPAPLWVAGSTVAGEEEVVLRAFRRVREEFPDARLVLAPRHPERFREIPVLVEATGFRCVRRTALDADGWRDGEVLLLDTMGELAQAYPLATAVFVGGSLVPSGGHNVLEAAVAGKAVVVGAHMENFQEIADELLAEGALLQVRSGNELAAAIVGLIRDEARRREIGERARGIVERNRGAVQRTADALAGLLA